MDFTFMLWHQEIVTTLQQLYIKLCRLFVPEDVINAIGTDGNNAARPQIYTYKYTANGSAAFSLRIHLWS
jgi:hypothetical protein